jgi:hypothetical protein
MNEDRPLNGENHNDFSLVRRPSSAVEKAAPGAKRILSGMVADTLALVRKARPIRIVILDDEEGPRRSYVAILKGCWQHGEEILEFEDARDAWQELSRTDTDLFITDIGHVGISCKEMLTRLAERKVKYPVLVISCMLGDYEIDGKKYPERAWVKEVRRDWRPNLNVTFLSKPFTVKEFRTAFEAALKIPRDAAAQLESCFLTGERYYSGKGVPQDFAEAVKWYRKAAEQDNATAQYTLGVCYDNGRGVAKDTPSFRNCRLSNGVPREKAPCSALIDLCRVDKAMLELFDINQSGCKTILNRITGRTMALFWVARGSRRYSLIPCISGNLMAIVAEPNVSEAVWMSLWRERTRPMTRIVLITLQFPQIIKIIC